MLDKQGRLQIGKGLIEKVGYTLETCELQLLFNPKERKMILIKQEEKIPRGFYFVKTLSKDTKQRIIIPKDIRKDFYNSKFMAVENNGKLYILIID